MPSSVGGDRRVGFNPPRPTLRPTIGSGLVISWAGMRGIVSLAAALALPATFPHRGLILLITFAVVLGTLSTQGLTLKPLLRALDLDDNDPVGQEVRAARRRALQAALASIPRHRSPIVDAVRHEFTAHLGDTRATAGSGTRARAEHSDMHRVALHASRQAVIAMRTSDEIGDDAFHEVEEQLDWLEMAGGGGES